MGAAYGLFALVFYMLGYVFVSAPIFFLDKRWECYLFTYLLLRHKYPRAGQWLAPVVPLIVVSTLLVKQHLTVDCLGGLVVGYGAYRLYLGLSGPLARAFDHATPGKSAARPENRPTTKRSA